MEGSSSRYYDTHSALISSIIRQIHLEFENYICLVPQARTKSHKRSITVHFQHDIERMFSPAFGFGSLLGDEWFTKAISPPADRSSTANSNHDADKSCKKPGHLVNSSILGEWLYGPCTPAKTKGVIELVTVFRLCTIDATTQILGDNDSTNQPQYPCEPQAVQNAV